MTTDTPTLDDCICECCGIEYELDDGKLPTPYCHECAHKLVSTLERDLAACRAALRELVACKDLHDRIDALDWSLYTFADAERANELQAEYDRRISPAWSAARAILQSTGEGEGK